MRAHSRSTLTGAVFAALLCCAAATGTAPERNIIVTNTSRNLDEFRAFAKTISRMKSYGKVQVDIVVLASKAAFEVPH